MAATGPPDDVECPLTAKVCGQPRHVIRFDGPRFLRLFAREVEGSAIRRTEGGPVARGEKTSAISDFRFVQARDREQHFAVAHSVEAVQAARHDPELQLLEGAVLLCICTEGTGAGAPA